MSSITQQKFYIQNIPLIFLLLLPPALLSGPFLSGLILVLVSFFFLFFSIKDQKFNYFNNFYFKIFSLFYFYILIRSFFSEDPFHSLESSLFYFRYGIFVLAVAYLLLYEKFFFKAFHFILYLSILFVCIDALFQYINGKNFFGFEKTDFQVSGVFGEEQILGSHLVRIFPILISYIFLNPKISFKIYLSYILIYILVAASIILSGERSAIFLFLLQIFLIYVLTKRHKLFQIINISLCFFILIFALFTFENIKSRVVYQTFNEIFDVKTEYQKNHNRETFNISENHFSRFNLKNIKFFSSQHTSHFKSALKMFESNILFGKGPKMFRKLCKEDKYFYENACSTHPHNIYIQLLAEIGIIGFLTVFLLFIYISYLLIKIKYNHFKKNIIYDDYTTILLILIFINLFPFVPTGNFFNNYISIYYFLPIGFLLAHLLQKKNNV